MGVFFEYPRADTHLSLRGWLLAKWPGKDGPNELFLWEKGRGTPGDLLIDDELRCPPDVAPRLRSPRRR